MNVLDRPGSTSILPKGTAFARLLQELSLHGDPYTAYESSISKFPGQPGISRALSIMAGISEKAATQPGTTVGWGSALAQAGIAADVIQLVAEGSVLGRLAPHAHRFPFGTPIPRALTRPSANWVGQGAAKPASAGSLDSLAAIDTKKLAVVLAFSRELARLGVQSEAVFTRMAVDALRMAEDDALLDPTNAGDANTPASITSGAASIASSGTSADQLAADLALLVDELDDLVAPFFISRARTAVGLAASTVSDATGRFVAGIPLLRSNGAPDGTLILLDANAIAYADDGDLEISTTEHASIQLDDEPSAGAQPHISLWQSNLVGLRVERFVSWTLVRANSVALLTGLWTA